MDDVLDLSSSAFSEPGILNSPHGLIFRHMKSLTNHGTGEIISSKQSQNMSSYEKSRYKRELENKINNRYSSIKLKCFQTKLKRMERVHFYTRFICTT